MTPAPPPSETSFECGPSENGITQTSIVVRSMLNSVKGTLTGEFDFDFVLIQRNVPHHHNQEVICIVVYYTMNTMYSQRKFIIQISIVEL